MAKMKVNELAKELEIESKAIVEFLKGTEYEADASQNMVEAGAQEMVRKHFSKKTASAKTEKTAEGDVKERPKNRCSRSKHYGEIYKRNQTRRWHSC